MKKIIFILFSLNLILTTCFAQSGWVKQSPYPQSGDLISSKFFNTNTGYAVSIWHNFIRTTNCGINWTVHTFGNNQVFAMDFVDMYTGFIVGANGTCYKTMNGGINWNDVSFSINKNLYAISFINDTGYILGSGQTIYKSTNRGNSWISKNIDTAIGFVDACFIDANTGHAIARDVQGNSKELITTNGGENWYFQQLAVNDVVNSIYFVNKNTGYIAGGFVYSNIQKTTNGGINWYVQFPPDYSLEDIMFTDNSTGYAVGAGGTLIKTNNGGESWESFSMNDIPYLITIYVINADNCYAMGSNGNIFKTTNSGTNWHNLFSGTVNDLNKVFFVNENTGYAVGNGTYGKGVVKTTNGGQYWFRQYIPTSAPLTSTCFLNNDTGFAVGWNGTFLKTTNGGNNWSESIISSYSLNSVLFMDFYTGYVVGSEIMKTTNSGVDWNSLTSFGGYSIYFINNSTGFVTSYAGRIYKSTNAGYNWTEYIVPTNDDFLSIKFVNDNTGYVAGGYDGTIGKTTDAGNSWVVKYTGTSLYLSSVYFNNANTGYVVGGYFNAVILKTTNGGESWFNQNAGISARLFSVQFLNDSTGYICGQGGIILNTITGGEPISVQPISSEKPNRFILHQNYPNPFNPVTKIKFDIPLLRGVAEGRGILSKICIYDVLGREVAVLVNQVLTPGTYEVEWDGSNYPSGVYFYRLESDGFSQTRKMVLLK